MDYQNDFQDMIARYNRELLRTYQRQRPSAPEPSPEPQQPLEPPAPPPMPSEPPEDTRPRYPLFEPTPFSDRSGPSRILVWAPVTAETEPAANVEDFAAAEPVLVELDVAEPVAAEPTEPAPMPAPAPATQQPPMSAPSSSVEPPMEVGYLQVWVTTARDALPVEGAHVTVTSTENGETVARFIGLTDRSGKTVVFPLPAVSRQLSLVPGNNPTPYTTYNIEVFADGYYRVENVGLPLYAGIKAVQPVQMIPLPEFGVENDTLVYQENGPTGLSGEEAGQA